MDQRDNFLQRRVDLVSASQSVVRSTDQPGFTMFMSNRTLKGTAGIHEPDASAPNTYFFLSTLQHIYWRTELEGSGGLGHTKTGRDRDRALYFPACNYDVDLLEFLVNAVARLPTYEVEALKVILEGCGGNANEAIAEIESQFSTVSSESRVLCEDIQDQDEESGCIVKDDERP
ncbi:uncharacterized protein NFIA_059610 [Aspergillus fischeri NRRL 181]|uniref:Uncharacterized protein n=1 Tax=Neosartorya fischeri (strain ATCC 1020 / DSM 3700 / CBS 544.65 / FGSC A1164 / JCM 1740 / NRRL 181 / WB 181) TaxID=331117 RepID=A1DP86_NEOFI|nr:uncharacterized protein NFIA_059610 [Aspergillus fischeri NRRL 181]EAW16607.1 hypothetical protein NFIA_059610 [Aspergillus fischeri NRRL 181]KAG2024393.1 hypothetical protein GB937_004050 [Aspergillus fischeri]